MPSTVRLSEPAPVARISGIEPITVEIVVITTGRSRMPDASMMASSNDWPASRHWLMNSTISTPFLAAMPISMTTPIWL